jgi:hypothetical protein
LCIKKWVKNKNLYVFASYIFWLLFTRYAIMVWLDWKWKWKWWSPRLDMIFYEPRKLSIIYLFLYIFQYDERERHCPNNFFRKEKDTTFPFISFVFFFFFSSLFGCKGMLMHIFYFWQLIMLVLHIPGFKSYFLSA